MCGVWRRWCASLSVALYLLGQDSQVSTLILITDVIIVVITRIIITGNTTNLLGHDSQDLMLTIIITEFIIMVTLFGHCAQSSNLITTILKPDHHNSQFSDQHCHQDIVRSVQTTTLGDDLLDHDHQVMHDHDHDYHH